METRTVNDFHLAQSTRNFLDARELGKDPKKIRNALKGVLISLYLNAQELYGSQIAKSIMNVAADFPLNPVLQKTAGPDVLARVAARVASRKLREVSG